MNKEIKVIFMGTPLFSVPILEALIKNYSVIAVVTKVDKEVGRGKKIIYSPIKELALKNNIKVIQPNNLRLEKDDIISLNPDIIITCAYGKIVPKEILDCPRLGCINVHASLLPKLRGGAPIHRAIIDGYNKTGITIMYMDEGMDTGDIISTKEIEIEDNDTASTLHDKLSILGSKLLLDTLPSVIDGTNNRIKQNDHEATYASVITKEDEKIDFNKTKKEINNLVRGLNSWPGAYTVLDNHRLKVWELRESKEEYPNLKNGTITKLYDDGIGVKVSDGEVILTLIQLEGKKKMDASIFINGIQNKKELIGKEL